MSSNPRLSLNQLFTRILTAGFIALIVASLLLIREERQRAADQWRLDAISKSSALTSAYYSNLTKKVILGNEGDISQLLQKIKQAENLADVRVVPQRDLSSDVLQTCKVDPAKAYFYQVPTCYEVSNGTLRIFHQLRSAGFGIGYLAKDIPIARIGIQSNPAMLIHIALVLLCFIVVNVVVLIYLRRYVMSPMQSLVTCLQENTRCETKIDGFGLRELHTLASSLYSGLDAITESQAKIKSYEFQAKLGQVVQQLAHDIRSPLAALDTLSSDIAELPEQKRIIARSAIGRIRDIANNLLEQHADNTSAADQSGVYLLSSLLDPVVSEERLQFRSKIGIEIDARLDGSSYGLFARVDPCDFKRVVSNLINNAVEALGERGLVTIRLSGTENGISLQVQDNGKGIPAEIIEKLGRRGETHGKAGGSGLGLYHAKTCAESWGGTLDIQSKHSQGTTVFLKPPRVVPPEWFVSRLQIPPSGVIVVLDDDTTIHQVWQERFDSMRLKQAGVAIHHFSTPEQLRSWVRGLGPTALAIVYLMDYELQGFKETGLKLIEELGLGEQSILVTSRFEEPEILKDCARLKVRLIPKGLAGFVPIIIQPMPSVSRDSAGITWDAVLIDDNKLQHALWKHAAQSNGKRLQTFFSPKEFLATAETLNDNTPIYVDSDLKTEIRGEDFARELHRRGFKNIYLSTGFKPQSFPPMPWIKGIIDKKAPWT